MLSEEPIPLTREWNMLMGGESPDLLVDTATMQFVEGRQTCVFTIHRVAGDEPLVIEVAFEQVRDPSFDTVGLIAGRLRQMSGNRLDIEAVLGETLKLSIALFSDEAETVPQDQTGCTLELVLEPSSLGENAPVVLTVGKGLTIPTPANGIVEAVEVIAAPAFDIGLGHWFLKRTDATGAVTYPKSGKLVIGNP